MLTIVFLGGLRVLKGTQLFFFYNTTAVRFSITRKRAASPFFG